VLNSKAAKQEAELNKAHHNKEITTTKLHETEKKLAAAKAESKGKDKTIDDLTAKAIAVTRDHATKQHLLQGQVSALQNSNDILVKKIELMISQNDKAGVDYAELLARFDKEHKDHLEDHRALSKEHQMLEHEKECRKTAEKELDEAKKELTNAATKIKGLEDKTKTLEQQVTGFEASAKEIDAAKNKLQEQFDTTNAALNKTTKDLEDADELNGKLSRDFEAARKALGDLTEEKKKVDSILITTKEELQTLKDAQAELVERAEEAEKEEKEAQDQLADANTALSDANTAITNAALEHKKQIDFHTKQANYLREEAKEAQGKLNKVKNLTPAQITAFLDWEAKRTELEGKVAALEIPKLHPNAGRFNILSVEYGGKSYVGSKDQNDIAVINKLYEYANRGEKFKAGNALFTDPWHGHKKSFSITYQVDGRGAPRHVYGLENGETKFST